MAYQFNVGTVPASGADALWKLISTMLAAGWTKVADSDGTTYSAAGTQVTGSNAGANGLNNNLAWVRMQAPGVNGGAIVGQKREFTFQISVGDGRSARIKYSASAGFIGGAPAAAATPSATDEQILTGSGTDAAPGFTAFIDFNGAGLRVNCACGGAPEFYSFYFFTTLTGTNNFGGGIALDVMAAGSYPATDPDPAVVYVATPNFIGTVFASPSYIGNVGGGTVNNVFSPMQTRAWLGATNVAGNFQGVALQSYSAAVGGSSGTGSNPFTGNDDLLPAWWMRPATSPAPYGLKGCSTLFQAGSVAARTRLDTADVASAKDWVFVGTAGSTCFLVPWNGTVPVI